MHTALTDIERIARLQISERTRLSPRYPRPDRRTRLAGALRRAADRLDG